MSGKSLLTLCLLSGLLASPLAAQDAHKAPIQESAIARLEQELATSGESRDLFRKSDLLYAGLFFGSLAALEPLEGVDQSLSPDRAPTGWKRGFYDAGWAAGHFVTAYAFGGATMLGGALLGDSRVTRVGLRSLEALAAADLVVGSFKKLSGRPRPLLGLESTGLDPFSSQADFNSFPSGHTAHLFALATTFSREFGEDAPWVPWVAYSLAGLTGVSRMVGQKHWLTDVVAGAAAGIFSAKLVGRFHGEDRPLGLPFRPSIITAGDMVGVGLELRF